MNNKQSIIASVTLTNSGKYKGKEVVQLYIRDLYGSLSRPLKELKGFEMVELEPGESKTVDFTIDNSLLKYYTVNKKWESESGDFYVYIGGDSDVNSFKKFELIN